MPAAASPESPFCPLLFTLTKPAAAAASDVADSTSIAIELEGAEANDMDGLDDSDDEEVANNTVATAPQTLRWWTPHGEAKQGSLVGAVAADKGMLSVPRLAPWRPSLTAMVTTTIRWKRSTIEQRCRLGVKW